MANYYEQYQIPYDYYYQVNNNLYDQNHYQYQQQEIAYDPMGYNQNHHQYQQQEIAYDPMGYNQNHYQYQQPEIAYDPMSYNNYYYNWNGSESETTSASSVAYSVSTMSEPKHLFYEPNYYTTYESPPQFNICRSVQGVTEQDFNEPEFDEYDPTPYNGGYDIVSTYGKPKPPSDITCYPSSNTSQGKLPSPPEIITPVPLGIYDGGEKKGEVKAVKKRVTFAEPVEEAKATETIKKEEEEEQGDDDDDEDDDDDDDDDEEEEEDHSSSYGNEGSVVNVEKEKEDHSLSHGSGNAENVEKGEVKALYVPSGYGLEATDICEAIFGGYFPCILRNKRRQKDEQDQAAYVSCWESNDSDPWKTTSDYLFGDLYPYGNENRVERNQFEIQSYGYRSY